MTVLIFSVPLAFWHKKVRMSKWRVNFFLADNCWDTSKTASDTEIRKTYDTQRKQAAAYFQAETLHWRKNRKRQSCWVCHTVRADTFSYVYTESIVYVLKNIWKEWLILFIKSFKVTKNCTITFRKLELSCGFLPLLFKRKE